jgi:hypothetical protein
MRSKPVARGHVAVTLIVLSCALAACGGGGGDAGSSTPPAATPSQAEATADATSGLHAGSDGAGAFDDVLETTQGLVAATAPAAAAATSTRAHALAAGAAGVVVDCAGGGTATISITGGTPGTQGKGVLVAGEVVDVRFAQCSGRIGLARLDGGLTVTVASASTTPAGTTLQAQLALSALAVTLPVATLTYDGSAQLARTVADAGDGTSTTTSHLTADTLSLATTAGTRTGSYTLTGLDATRTLSARDGLATGSVYSGGHTLNGTAGGTSFALAVTTNGGVTFDPAGRPTSGEWTTVRPDATVVTHIADDTVTLTVDVGNDGVIDRTWTFPLDALPAAPV